VDDLLPVAPADARTGDAMLLPEALDFLLDLLVLGSEKDIVASGELVQQLGAALGQPLDLRSDLVQCHALKNDWPPRDIPSAPEEVRDQHEAADDGGRDRNRVPEADHHS
jgi:hypothetical protein